MSTAKGKSEAVERLKPILHDIGDPIQRQHYVQRLARLVRMDERTLAESMGPAPRPSARARAQAQGEVTVPGRTERATYEDYVLFLILRTPSLVPWVQATLAETGMESPRLDEFRDPRSRALIEQIWNPLSEGAPWEDVRLTLSDVMKEHLDDLAQQMASLPPLPDEQVRAEALGTLLRLRQQRLKGMLEELKFLTQDAEEQHDQEAVAQYALAFGERTQQLKAVQRALTSHPEQRRGAAILA